jgi:hypothetical protein
MDWSDLVLGAVVALIVLVIGTYLANTPKLRKNYRMAVDRLLRGRIGRDIEHSHWSFNRQPSAMLSEIANAHRSPTINNPKIKG